MCVVREVENMLSTISQIRQNLSVVAGLLFAGELSIQED